VKYVNTRVYVCVCVCVCVCGVCVCVLEYTEFLYTQLHESYNCHFNYLKPTGHVMHQQFNIQQLYALPTLYLCVLYLSENKQRLVPFTE